MDCKNFELYWLRVYEEAIPGGEDGFLRHTASCPRCAARKVELDRVQALLTARTVPTPKPEALQQARWQLSARLQAQQQPIPKTAPTWISELGGRVRSRWDLIGAWSWQTGLATASIVLGLVLGRVVFNHPTTALMDILPASVSETSPLDRSDLVSDLLTGATAISGLHVRPIQPDEGLVEISFRAARDYTIQGKPDDQLVMDLLGWAVKHEENSGVRLQSVQELARASELSTRARQVLAYALVNDQNDGVRLKALEALATGQADELTEQAILNALLKDPNPAVRIQAINSLLNRQSAPIPDHLLFLAAQGDSNEYVRRLARQAVSETQGNFHHLDQDRTANQSINLDQAVWGDRK